MRHGIVTIVLVAMVVGGCGGSSVGPPVSTAREGERVDADRYLADVAAGAAAVRSFSGEMTAIVNPAGENELRALAPRLQPSLAQAKLVSQRLEAERLDDTRLDEQRQRSAADYKTVVGAMERVAVAAEQGDAVAAQTASADLARATSALAPEAAAP